MASSRFASATSDFQLDELVTRLRKGFLMAIAAAIGIHLVLASINPFEETQTKAPRPMSTKFIKREPRLTKALELRKIPQPKRQLARRQVKLAAARMDQVQATANFNTRSLIASHVGGSGISLAGQANFSAMSTLNLEPKLAAASVTSTRASEHKIDMALEMLDVNSMDTGRYRAMVIQDASDKQAIKGFVRMAMVMSARSIAAGTVGGSSLNMKTIDRLRDVINEYTGLKAEFVGSLTFDDDRLMEVPIILPQGGPNEAEMANLARYLIAGGFTFSGLWGEALEKYGGLVQGKDFWSERLPEDHPVFSAFFDLEGGMPFGYSPSLSQGKSGVQPWNYLTGHFLKGRLAGITPGNGGWGWQNDTRGGDSTRQLQLAVNIVIYALTQEGSITQRLMQMVN
ncbi:MAG: DUF4159 domain-containing protein [Candidatus Latescibacteria bacterium]|nr:DUF4159 domain-containing protein [Candidatus Latescibacterota bacterium]